MEPFKVICVGNLDLSKVPAWAKKMVLTKPEPGDRCTVTEVATKKGITYYTVAEQPEYMEYDSRAFATLPSATDEQAIEAEQEAIIYAR